MTAYMAGNIVGRIIFAFLLVFISVLVFKKFKPKPALKTTLSIRGCTAIGLLFALPLLNQMGAVL